MNILECFGYHHEVNSILPNMERRTVMKKRTKRTSKLVAILLTLVVGCTPIGVQASEMCLGVVPQRAVEHRSDAVAPFATYNAYAALYGDRSGMYCKSYSDITAYFHKAQCTVNNNGQTVTTSGWTTQYNTTAASSNYVYATTNVCTYTGEGQSKHTSSSNLAAGTLSKSYN